ncbi:CREC-EF hand family protein [Winogradskyella ursingii]|uniref:hypothetical protein n=1 Tax=Winogradskyella ursingii TaxID=2686079 RepID=UPI001C53E7F4|nr:hypothetical protein [Winogradskyella ursingii]
MYYKTTMKVLNALLIVSFFSMNLTVSAQTESEQTRRFKLIDADRNEVITIREMKKFYNGKTNKDGEPIDAKKMFYGLDANRNSIITLNEFIKDFDLQLAYEYVDRWEYKPTEEGADKVAEKFTEIDSNLNKELTLDEMINFYRGMTNKETGDPINGKLNFHTYDANNDGVVTQEEFAMEYNWKEDWGRIESAAKTVGENQNDESSEAYIKERIDIFEEVDTDSNFKVTLEELSAYYKGKTNSQGKPVNAEFQFYGHDKDEDGIILLEEFASKIDLDLAQRKFKKRKE